MSEEVLPNLSSDNNDNSKKESSNKQELPDMPEPPKPANPLEKIGDKKEVSKNNFQKKVREKPVNNKYIKQDFNKKEKTYHNAKKLSWDEIKNSIPKEMVPTKITDYMFGVFFMLGLIGSLFLVPYGDIIQGEMNIQIKIGLPLPFLVLNTDNTDEFPLRIGGLFLDLFVYFLLGYAIDVVYKLMFSKSSKDGDPAKEYMVSDTNKKEIGPPPAPKKVKNNLKEKPQPSIKEHKILGNDQIKKYKVPEDSPLHKLGK